MNIIITIILYCQAFHRVNWTWWTWYLIFTHSNIPSVHWKWNSIWMRRWRSRRIQKTFVVACANIVNAIPHHLNRFPGRIVESKIVFNVHNYVIVCSTKFTKVTSSWPVDCSHSLQSKVRFGSKYIWIILRTKALTHGANNGENKHLLHSHQ